MQYSVNTYQAVKWHVVTSCWVDITSVSGWLLCTLVIKGDFNSCRKCFEPSRIIKMFLENDFWMKRLIIRLYVYKWVTQSRCQDHGLQVLHAAFRQNTFFVCAFKVALTTHIKSFDMLSDPHGKILCCTPSESMKTHICGLISVTSMTQLS